MLNQVGSKALIQAQTIASTPEVIVNMENGENDKIAFIFQRLNQLSDADYIVIADLQEIRLYHPNPAHINKKINSKDNHNALVNGKSYVSKRVGESGLSIRGKAPIITPEGKIVGVISVGYLIEKLSDRIRYYALPIFGVVVLAIILAFIGAAIFSAHIKSQMFNMEPQEIAQTLQIKKSVMQSMYEGLIATTRDGTVLSINKSALKMLGIAKSQEELKGRSIQEFVTPATFFLSSKKVEAVQDVADEIITCNGENFIATRVKMTNNDEIMGSVVSLRRQDDITTLTTQLAQAQHYLDNLRVIRHEHDNKLSTLCGLLQIGAYDKALQILENTHSKQQAIIDSVTNAIKSRVIAGLLLGKISRAEELDLKLELDPMSALVGDNWPINEEELSTMIGNLLDNAFESTILNTQSNKIISLLINDIGSELIVVVSDNGTGFGNNDPLNLLRRGMTSKTEKGHGIGLHLVNQYVKKAGGTLMMEESEPQGATFSIYIPKILQETESLQKGTIDEGI
ncbi:ATP-binding protein [Vibrio algarum]|uniref:histidine kinase n=1 Tax=Vibrio algarum TaxID=3020714 RepID=A0ABT4YU47_9VIBR|nr:sensor histidine kinase [Vibrio sp. KJ40-1]MDB1125108.1 sensor histidine kinase [Vibrio sp. KJ40-1]